MKLKYPTLTNFFNYNSTPVIPLEVETTTFINRVIADGGKVLDETKLNNFYKNNKIIGKYNSLQLAVSKQFGYKVVSGNITKIYDASKNKNDLIISSGTVSENIANNKFFLLNAWFKNETIIFDIIGDRFTLSSTIMHTNPDAKAVNYILGLSDLLFMAGGNHPDANGLLNYRHLTPSITEFKSTVGTFNNVNDAGVDRTLWYRHNRNITQNTYKDGVNQGVSQNTISDLAVSAPIKIVYGNRTSEAVTTDADCFLNDTFFYNDYLTDAELAAINNI